MIRQKCANRKDIETPKTLKSKKKKKKKKKKEVKLKFRIYQKQVKAKFPAQTQIYDDFIKKHHLLFNFFFASSKKFFKLYSMCFKYLVKE